MTVIVPNLLASHPSLPASNVKELIAHIKSRPGQMQFASAGVPGYDAVTWFGVLAPAGTPRAIVAQLHTNVARAVNDPVIRKRFVNDGTHPSPSASPEAFALLICSEVSKWAKVIRDAGIQPE